jgi:hypothetical protein
VATRPRGAPFPRVRLYVPAVITALAFIITFIVVGLVVVAAAFSGGRRRAERPAGPDARGRRAHRGLGVVVLSCSACWSRRWSIASAKDARRPGGVKLTPPTSAGARSSRALRDVSHARGGERRGQGRAEPRPARRPLDQGQKLVVLTRSSRARARAAARCRANLVDGQDAQDVAAFVAAVAGH